MEGLMGASRSSALRKLCVGAASLAVALLILLGAEGFLRLAGLQRRADPFRFEALFLHLTGERLIVEHPTRFFAIDSHYRLTPEYAGLTLPRFRGHRVVLVWRW